MPDHQQIQEKPSHGKFPKWTIDNSRIFLGWFAKK
jgi:hypothetical protein